MSMFANAKAATSETKPAKKKSDKVEVDILGINDIATIDLVIAAMTAVRENLEEAVKTQMHNQFVIDGEKIGRRPNSFRGIDGDASASCELRKRSTRSVLSPEEQALLESNNIPYETIVDVPEAYIINPAYASDTDLLEKVSKVLEGVAGLPADFIQFQPKVERKVASDASMDAIFKNKVADDLMNVVGTLSLKPTTENTDLEAALEYVKVLLKK